MLMCVMLNLAVHTVNIEFKGLKYLECVFKTHKRDEEK